MSHRLSLYTSVLGTSLMTAKPPAMSPYSVAYPMAISLLLPVVSVSHPNLLEMDMIMLPRMRAWTFSSAMLGSAPLKYGSNMS